MALKIGYPWFESSFFPSFWRVLFYPWLNPTFSGTMSFQVAQDTATSNCFWPSPGVGISKKKSSWTLVFLYVWVSLIYDGDINCDNHISNKWLKFMIGIPSSGISTAKPTRLKVCLPFFLQLLLRPIWGVFSYLQSFFVFIPHQWKWPQIFINNHQQLFLVFPPSK